MTSIHRPLKLQLFIRVILARGVWKPVGMSAACEADVSWIIACPSNFAYLTSVLGLEIASRVTFDTGFLKLSTASWQTGACSTIRTESARGLSNLALSNLAGGVPTLCSQSSRPFPHRAFASGLPMEMNTSACTSAASSCSAQSSRPGASTCKIASACKPH